MIKNKTLIYSPSQGVWGGGQIYIEQLCDYMNNRGIVTYVLTADPEKFSCQVKRMGDVISKRKRFLSSIMIARKYRKDGFDTIILNDLSSLWLAPVFHLFGYKVISLLHLYLQKKSVNPLGHSWIEYCLFQFSINFCDDVFSVNKDNQKVFPKKKIDFIGNYVPDWFFDAPRYRGDERYDFILIARFSKQKNIPLFLDLLAQMNDRLDRTYNALIVGEGPEYEDIQNRIKIKGLQDNIKLEKWVERTSLPSLYDRGKCFVISSYHEGFATTLLEAHARGIPAVVTRSSGFCGEFVEGYNTSTGIVFEPMELTDPMLYEKLETLIKNHEVYKDLCITKAKIFSEVNVLDPIIKAVKR